MTDQGAGMSKEPPKLVDGVLKRMEEGANIAILPFGSKEYEHEGFRLYSIAATSIFWDQVLSALYVAEHLDVKNAQACKETLLHFLGFEFKHD